MEMVVTANIIFEALAQGWDVLWDYLSAHTLTCLVPAFFIAGAIVVFVKKEAVLKYLGAGVKNSVSYPIASVSGSVLAVCSCTVLPLFAGIYKKGAGIGPATTFLYSGPGINILAIVLTASVLGFELGLARAVSAIILSIIVGLTMATVFRREEEAQATGNGKEEGGETVPNTPSLEADGSEARSGWVVLGLFALLLAILLVGTSGLTLLPKVLVLLALIAATVYLAWTQFDRDEREDWGYETWDLTKKILPVLLIGAFVLGVISYFIPPETFAPYLGENGLLNVFLGAIIGALLYMPTLLEVPIVGDLFGYSEGAMASGPALALLLAGPAVSLPNMIVLYRIIGGRKTLVYIVSVIITATVAGLIYGNIVD